MKHNRHAAFARILSSAVISQGLLSATSFVIGLILIRRTNDLQYGYYILASSALLLLSSLQNAFFNPPLALRMGRLDRAERGALVGGLYREQRRSLPMLGGIAVIALLLLQLTHVVSGTTAALIFATIVASLAILNREYFRMVLLVHHRSHAVLRVDIVYAALMIVGAFLATFSVWPALTAVLTLAFAALISGLLMARTLHRFEPWDTQGAKGIIREIADVGIWSTAGAAIHWSFSQGYAYLVAATLNVAAVAAIAATRLMMMPINLLSSGISSLMFPMATGWLREHGPSVLLRRLTLFALGMAAMSLCYFAVLWWMRDWLFDTVLKKHFAQRDLLLILWCATFLMMVIRDQMIYLLAALGRFRTLTSLTSLSALASLVLSYLAMSQFGMIGAPLGVLAGEIINVTGIVVMSCRAAERPLLVAA